MTTVVFQGDDLRWLFETLVDAVEITLREGERPAVVVNGKRYPPYALLKVAAFLPDEPLQPHHQIVADQLFQKKQKGYRRTAYNLAQRADQFASDARHLRLRERARGLDPLGERLIGVVDAGAPSSFVSGPSTPSAPLYGPPLPRQMAFYGRGSPPKAALPFLSPATVPLGSAVEHDEHRHCGRVFGTDLSAD